MRTISCATAVSSACSSVRSSRDALGQPLLHRRAPLVGGHRDPLDQVGDAAPGAGRDRRAGDRLRATASSRDRPAPRSTAVARLRRQRALRSARRRSGCRSRIVIACGSRSRSPGVSAPVTRPALARLLERRLERRAELLVELDLDAGRLPQLQRDAQLDASARDVLARPAPRTLAFDRRERLRHAQLQIEVAMVHRANRHGDRRALVLARHRRQTRS